MSRSFLKFFAALLGVLIVVVYFAGLDNLPRSLRTEIDPERRALAAAQAQLQSGQDEVLRNLQTEAALFHAIPASQQWPEQLSKDLGDLQLASHQMEQLTALEKQNRRQDRAQVESLLAQERGLRTGAIAQASAIQKEAAHWVDAKRHLPDELQKLERDYGVIHNFDLAPLAAAVAKSRSRLARQAGRSRIPPGECPRHRQRRAIRSGNPRYDARKQVVAGDLAHVDIPTPDRRRRHPPNLRRSSAQAGRGTEIARAANSTTPGTSCWWTWRRAGSEYDQKIRTVQTHFADASAKNGEIGSDEKWVPVSAGHLRGRQAGPRHGHRAQARRQVRRGSRARGAARRLRLCRAALAGLQPVRLLGPPRRTRFLGLLRPVRAAARPAVQPPVPAHRPLRLGRLPHLPDAAAKLITAAPPRATTLPATAPGAAPPRSATPAASSPRAEVSATRGTHPRAAPTAIRHTPRPAATALRGNSEAAAGRKITAPARPRVPRRGRRTGRPARLEDSESGSAAPAGHPRRSQLTLADEP